MKSLSKTGAAMHSFEPQFSLQGEFDGKLDLLVCSNEACKATDKAILFIGGGALVVLGKNR